MRKISKEILYTTKRTVYKKMSPKQIKKILKNPYLYLARPIESYSPEYLRQLPYRLKTKFKNYGKQF